MVHAHAATVAALAVSVWFLYVPSAANLADLPSRHDYALLAELGSRRVAVVWPAFARWDQPASVSQRGSRRLCPVMTGAGVESRCEGLVLSLFLGQAYRAGKVVSEGRFQAGWQDQLRFAFALP